MASDEESVVAATVVVVVVVDVDFVDVVDVAPLVVADSAINVPLTVVVAHPNRNYPKAGPLPPSHRGVAPRPLRYPKACSLGCHSFQS